MAGGSRAAVYSAIGANSLVMVGKFVGFVLTGSGTMLAESIHSMADVANQTLLVVGMRRSQLPPDEDHPFGYGRDAFIWALMSAVGIFFIGCGVTVAHGVHGLLAGGEHQSGNAATINLTILGVAFLAEGASLWIALRGLMAEARQKGIGLREHVRTTDDPFSVAVLLEDSAAVLGVVIAAVCILLGEVTHATYWDSLGSIVIGVLLGGVAMFLTAKNRTMLIGRSISQDDQERLHAVLEADPAVEHVAVARGEVAGADAYRISAEIELDGHHFARLWLSERDTTQISAELSDSKDLPEFLGRFADDIVEMVGDEVDRIEAKIRDEIPRARDVDLELD